VLVALIVAAMSSGTAGQAPGFGETTLFTGTRVLCIDYRMRLEFVTTGQTGLGTWRLGGVDTSGNAGGVHTTAIGCGSGRYQGWWTFGTWNNSLYTDYRLTISANDGRVSCQPFLTWQRLGMAYNRIIPDCTFSGQGVQYPTVQVNVYGRLRPTSAPTRSPTRAPTRRPTTAPTRQPSDPPTDAPVTVGGGGAGGGAAPGTPTAAPSTSPTPPTTGGGGGGGGGTPTALPTGSPTPATAGGGGGGGSSPGTSTTGCTCTNAPTADPASLAGGGGTAAGPSSGGPSDAPTAAALSAASPTSPTAAAGPTTAAPTQVFATSEECGGDSTNRAMLIIPWILIVIAFIVGGFLGRMTAKRTKEEEDGSAADAEAIGRKEVIANPVYAPTSAADSGGYLTVTSGKK